MHPRAAAVLVAFALTSVAAAQLPFGTATPLGSHRPELFSEPLWLGNLGYGYRVENGPPNGDVLLVVSVARQDQTLLGLELYPSLGPGDVLVVDSAVLDANGRALLSRPLPGPEVPALAGLCLYAQAAVAGPSGLGSTQGLLIEAALHPMLAFGNANQGLVLIDLVHGTSTSVAGVSLATGGHAAVFANGGRDLFVAGLTGLFVVDTTAAAPTAVPLLTGPACIALAWDRVHRRLYVTRQAVEAIDGDRTSPTFGTVLAQSPPVPGFTPGRLSLTADGTRLVHAANAGHFERYDTDPASPTYLHPIATPAPPVQLTFLTQLDAVHMAPDGRITTVVIRQPAFSRSELHRFDAATGAWIDHDAVAAGTQPLSFLTHTLASSTFAWHATRDGSAAYLTGGSGCNSLRLDLGGPGVAVLPSPLPPANVFNHYHGASPTGRYMLMNIPLLPANELVLVDVASGATIPLATVPPFGSGQLMVAWR